MSLKLQVGVESNSEKNLLLLPCLEICIQHPGHDHSQFGSRSMVTYKFKDADGNVTDLDIEKNDINEHVDETGDDFTYEHQGSLVTIKKSTINELRKQNQYYGPLKVVQKLESEKIVNGISEKVYSTCLEPVDFTVTQNGDKSISDQELSSLLIRTPGIIPPCSLQTKKNLEDVVTIIRKGRKKYSVSNSALKFFKEKTGYNKNFDYKIEEIFHTSDETIGLLPVTLITLFKKKKNTALKSSLLNKKKKQLIRRRKIIQKPQKINKICPSYATNYTNRARRGNLLFSEIKRVGINFIDELLLELPVQDDLKDFSESFSSNVDKCYSIDGIRQGNDNFNKIAHQEGNKEHAYDIWKCLIITAQQNPFLISFEYVIDKEKWVELRRNFNTFQIDGESLADIVIKVVLRDLDCIMIDYYVRCLNRSIKQGKLTSLTDVMMLLKIFDVNKYVCIGFDKEKYIYQCDENYVLRKLIKESGQMSICPFESIRDKKCKGIVCDLSNIGNFKFERGNVTIFGPPIVCRPCEKLLDRLEELYDSSLNILVSKKGCHRMTKQRYGPIQTAHISRNIRKLCLETPYEFVSQSQKVSDRKKFINEETFPRRLKLFDIDADLLEDERPVIKVSEQEFGEMISIKSCIEEYPKLIKVCKKCGYQAPTMLTLFFHMSCHIGKLTEECKICSLKLSNNEAVKQHVMQCHSKECSSCSICQEVFSSKELLFVHMNCHRKGQPYVCWYCEHRHQTQEIYRKHMKHAHNMETIKEMNFICQICSCHFITYDHLLIHSLNSSHVDKNLMKCKICNFSCTLISLFLTHLLSHTGEQREYHNLAVCQECKKAFFSTFELEDHLREHKNIIVQHKEIVLSVDQEIHAEISNNIAKSFICKKCIKAFGTERDLQKHCEVCVSDKAKYDQTFSSSSQYSYSCNQCFMKFTSEYFLNVHTNSHCTSHRSTFQNEGSNFRTEQVKLTESLNHSLNNEDNKNVEKQQSTLQQLQPSHGNSYNQLFSQSQHQQISYANNSVPVIDSESHGAQAIADSNWNQQQNPSSLEESHDSVYSLLHL